MLLGVVELQSAGDVFLKLACRLAVSLHSTYRINVVSKLLMIALDSGIHKPPSRDRAVWGVRIEVINAEVDVSSEA